jgi:alpha-beta hydrolase superfamily lysophospholipase
MTVPRSSVHRPGRRRARAAAVTLAFTGCLAVCAVTAPAARAVTSRARAVTAVPVPAGHGALVRSGPLPDSLRLAGSGASRRLWYTSADWAGRATVVSGTLTVPAGTPPAGGWPVVSFGHGFGGTADSCAPSRTGPSPMERAVQEALVARGHAVVVSDYAGIGTPGTSSLINGTSEGRNLVDIVLAARRVAPLARSWVSLGYSLGGHAALFAGATADAYAPSLHLAGTISMAGFLQPQMIIGPFDGYDPAGAVNPVVPFLIDGLTVTAPGDFRAGLYLTERGRQLVSESRRICLDAMMSRTAGLSNADLYTDGGGLFAEFHRLYAAQEVPVVGYSRPVTLIHGLEDTIPAAVSQVTAERLAAAGTDARYVPVAGADHLTLLPMIATEVAGRVATLFTDDSGGSPQRWP